MLSRDTFGDTQSSTRLSRTIELRFLMDRNTMVDDGTAAADGSPTT